MPNSHSSLRQILTGVYLQGRGMLPPNLRSTGRKSRKRISGCRRLSSNTLMQPRQPQTPLPSPSRRRSSRRNCVQIVGMVLVKGHCVFSPSVSCEFIIVVLSVLIHSPTDGGGVRGISALHVLKAIMGKITGDPNAKPCDYFDMMCGTSTGG